MWNHVQVADQSLRVQEEFTYEILQQTVKL